MAFKQEPIKGLKNKLRHIRMVVMDVDGVLTDGSIIYSSDGKEFKRFHVHDGYGIFRARDKGLMFAIISGRTSKVTTIRAKRLEITDVFQGDPDKAAVFEKIKSKYKLGYRDVCFIGDDEFDLPLLHKVGFSAAPRDAIKKVRDEVDYVTKAEGGRGAVREILDLILEAKELL
ncbi:MAG: HAD-IIIA family hydrolase [Bacteroidota bacterium]|nr:HAD-IIIA family hydrolase [Bacteroidota bacterium]